VPVLADAAQSVGAIPTTAAGVDFLAISGQKWLCGPDSTGALVVRDPERLRVVSPSHFSQRRHEPDGTYDPHDGARRFESGWWSYGALRAMLAALELRPPWWYERASAAAERCRELLSRGFDVLTPRERSTIVAFAVDDDPVAVVARLHDADVHVREIPRRGIVRVSCGWWTSDDDLERLVAALDG
jgi:L-cysteine/cystine lyase